MGFAVLVGIIGISLLAVRSAIELFVCNLSWQKQFYYASEEIGFLIIFIDRHI